MKKQYVTPPGKPMEFTDEQRAGYEKMFRQMREDEEFLEDIKRDLESVKKILGNRQCRKCDKVKPLIDFKRRKACNKGYEYTCKACESAYRAEKSREERSRKRCTFDPDVVDDLRKQTQRLVHEGVLVPQPCEECGMKRPLKFDENKWWHDKVQAHHLMRGEPEVLFYNQPVRQGSPGDPLVVEWLCGYCHHSRHNKGHCKRYKSIEYTIPKVKKEVHEDWLDPDNVEMFKELKRKVKRLK